jgi:radical SAM-linked protein
MKAQRLRFRYRLTAEAAITGHRDLLSRWEAAAKAAGLPLSYSSGKRPAPQISLAAPLPQGATSDAEIAEVYLECRVDPKEALRRIAAQLPAGIEATSVREVGVGAPAVQSSLRWAEWDVAVPADEMSEADVRAAIERLLAASTLPSVYSREKKTREYDLRPLVLGIEFVGREGEEYVLRMRLRAEQDNTARADQTVLALGLPPPSRVHRTKLEVDDSPAAVREYRRLGEPEDDG